MKRESFIKLLAAFAVGLILCGVGLGVLILEISTLKPAETNTAAAEQSRDYVLPEGKKLYVDGYHAKVVTDENIPAGTMKMTAKYQDGSNIVFDEIKEVYLCEETYKNEDSANVSIAGLVNIDAHDYDGGGSASVSVPGISIEAHDRGDLDEDFDDDDFDEDPDEYGFEEEEYEDEPHVVKHKVMGLNTADYSFGGDDTEEIKKFLDSLKHHELYMPKHSEPEFTLTVNPADAARVILIGEHHNAWFEEMGVYAGDDIDGIVSDVPAEITTVTENTKEPTTVARPSAEAVVETTTKV